jgi:2',3'-cyclic-nucleotide 2'-phosphodiesterase (5'-nucleotidase family)
MTARQPQARTRLAHRFTRRCTRIALAAALALGAASAWADALTILHVGDQESWLVSAQGNLRDDATQTLSFYGGVDRLATVIAQRRAAAQAAGRTVLTLNAGDAFLPGPRLAASFANLATAHPDGGQDFYDTIAKRRIGFDAIVFGNHEFDLDNTGPVAARFAEVSGSTYLSVNLDFSVTPPLADLAARGIARASKVFTTASGFKVGVVGVTTPLLPGISSPPAGIMRNWSAGNTEQQNLQALLPLVQAEIDDLRNNQGVQTIIILSHLQGVANERDLLVPGLRGVDLVISGGGHELMRDPDDLLIPGATPTFATHPILATDASGRSVPVVTSNFGNRYVGEVRIDLDDSTGAVRAIEGTSMLRVSGRSGDPDAVAGDPVLFAQVVQPVLAHIAVLNAQVIGQTAVRLSAARGGACTPLPCRYAEGIRRTETNLGNLVADSLRHFAGTDIALQNGGGIRADIAGPGPITVGDTFNTLTFTNLLTIAHTVNAAQLKDIFEHAFSGSTPNGVEQGRFPQISGLRIEYDTTRPARPNTAGNVVASVGQGERVRRIVLDDGTVLVDNGIVVDSTRTVSLATIDFLANGGDNYPFAANGVVFTKPTNPITYQEALVRFLQTPKAQGGLRRSGAADGPEVTANKYGPADGFDLHGRMIDLAVARATPGSTVVGSAGRDTLAGTAGDDLITGGPGADLLTGGAGGDIFRYTSLRDLGDTIVDFTPHADRIDLGSLLAALGVAGSAADAVASGHLRFADVAGGVQLLVDADGTAGPAVARPLLTLRGLTAAQMTPGRDLLPSR